MIDEGAEPTTEEPTEEKDTSLRDDIMAAMDQAEAATEPAPEAVKAAPEEVSEKEKSEPAAGRDEKGRFVPGSKKLAKNATAAQSKVTPPPPEAQPAGAPQAPELKAPASWKANIREKWAALPPEVKQEVQRREMETTRVMQEAAESRKLAQAFNQAVNPYMAMIQAEGSNPIQAVGKLLQTAAALRTAPPGHKAQLVAQLIRDYGVPIDILDQALSGQAPGPQSQAQQPYRDPRVDQLLHQLQQAQEQRAQSIQERNAQEVAEFEGRAEFLDDVRDTMADLLEVAARRNQTLSLDDAYSRAIQLHPEIAEVMRQREAAKSVATAQASTQRAKNAASSIRSQPAVASRATQSNGSLRDDIMAAMEELAAR